MQWTDLVLIAILFGAIIMLITALGSLWVLIPYVPTPYPIVHRMIELARLEKDSTVFDLGCGDGRILIEAKKKHPGIRAIGYELPLGIWLLAKAKVWLSRQNVTIHMRDFRKANLREADVIFLYLFPDIFPLLSEKLAKEVKPGTRIISHGFAFPDRTPQHVERYPLPSWKIFRKMEKQGPRIYVYEW